MGIHPLTSVCPEQIPVNAQVIFAAICFDNLMEYFHVGKGNAAEPTDNDKFWIMDEEKQYEIFDPFENEDENETYNAMDELKDAAFEYLLLNPGSEFGDWEQGLISDYPTEVVDALGDNPHEVFADLADLWESDYCDPKTDIEQSFAEWAMSFATENAVGIYYYLVDACAELAKMGRKFP